MVSKSWIDKERAGVLPSEALSAVGVCVPDLIACLFGVLVEGAGKDINQLDEPSEP